jgi:hypothetical protein
MNQLAELAGRMGLFCGLTVLAAMALSAANSLWLVR